jgi:hypothetical protein
LIVINNSYNPGIPSDDVHDSRCELSTDKYQAISQEVFEDAHWFSAERLSDAAGAQGEWMK